MSIEVGLTEPQPLEVTFEEICAGVEVSVDSNPVIIEFPTPPEIQVAVNEVHQTNGGGGSGKSPYVGGNGNWFYYNDVTQQYIDSGVKAQGNPGKTAYQSAVDGGYTNTEPQFNTDLSQVNNKVDKVAGKGLSTNDFTNTLKGKLDSTEIFTAAEKTQGALATGMANPSPISGKDLSTVKKLAQEFDNVGRLIGVYTPIAGTSAIEIKYDMYGNLLSALNIKRLFVDAYVKSTASAIQVGVLRVNNVSSSTYKMTNNLYAGILFRNNAETYMFCSLDFNGILKYTTNGMHSATTVDDAASLPLNYIGINRSIAGKTLEQIDLILGGTGVTFAAGSVISIYAI